MEIEDLQKEINAIDYWDCEVLDFSISYFGDEARIVMACEKCPKSEEDEKQICCTIKFLFCYQVEYITDAKDDVWRKNIQVKNMNRCQLGHYMQEINVKESGIEGFIEINLNTSLLSAKIVCKEIVIENIECVDSDFFWSMNKK